MSQTETRIIFMCKLFEDLFLSFLMPGTFFFFVSSVWAKPIIC